MSTHANRARRQFESGTRVALVAGTAAAGLLLTPASATAQTWAGTRSTPTVAEIVAIDATGEDGWPFGSEDVAGDGLDQFQQPEQSIDVRTAYGVAINNELIFRLYVSAASAPGDNVSGYVFIDNDESAMTGGTAVAPEIDARFDVDPSPGGYEFVVGVAGDETVIGVWSWDDQATAYTDVTVTPAEAEAEAGADLDPIRIANDQHGYLQGRVAVGVVGLTNACDANLFFRSLNETASLGDGDLDVGLVGPCVPADGDGNNVPDVIVPDDDCSTDDDCPANGLCLDGDCIFTGVCTTDSDCDADETCDADGFCVLTPGGSCDEPDDCVTQVCSDGQCELCDADADCPEGDRCAASGACLDADMVPPGGDAGADAGDAGPMLGEGEEVQGGACTCGVWGNARSSWLAWLIGLPALLLLLRRRITIHSR